MNDQFFEMDETDNEEELLAFDHEDESGDYEDEYASGASRDDREIELAAELLSVSGEQELDQFLGKIMRGARGILNTAAGRKLKDLLRKTAGKALPLAGQAIGGYFGGDRGAAFGGKVASAGGQLFGLETEGLSPEDRELQVARQFVRLAEDAAQELSTAPSGGNPATTAQTALLAAARRHAPGLASLMHGAGGALNSRSEDGGRWIRRGGNIVVLGV